MGRDPDDFSVPAIAFDEDGKQICTDIEPITRGAYTSVDGIRNATRNSKAARDAVAVAAEAIHSLTMADKIGGHSMTITPRQIRFFWTGARKVGLSEVTIRSTLVQIAGVTSVKEPDGDGFAAMVGYFEYLGFAPAQAQGRNFGKRTGMASFAQLELIRVLWREYTGEVYGCDEGQINKWLVNKWKRSSLRFMTATDARKMITALKNMKARAA